MEFHTAANIFPMMAGKDFDGLVEDIRTNGLLEAIWTYENRIIDGRNRYRACQKAKVEPRFREWQGECSLISFIVSLNLHRRHLDASQRSMVAARLVPNLAVEAKKRQMGGLKQGASPVSAKWQQRETGRAATQAAALLSVSPRSVARAISVLAEATPEVIQQVDQGKLSVAKAAKAITSAKEKHGSFGDPAPKWQKMASHAWQFARIAISQLERIPVGDSGAVQALTEVKDWIEDRLEKEK
jgi:hypothetical protein